MKPKQQPPTPKKRGRPDVLVMPDPIPDTPENIARACMQGPPKKDWDFLKPGSGARRHHEHDAV